MSATKFVQSNSIRMAYESMGPDEGPVIILVAGLYNQLIRWPTAFCELLIAHGYRVIRFDNRDIGLTEKMDNQTAPTLFRLALRSLFGIPAEVPYTLEDMADDTVGLMDALGIDIPTICAFSISKASIRPSVSSAIASKV